MNAKDFIMKALTYWFDSQLSIGCSLEETVRITKICVLLDTAQLFLGYGDDEMAIKDDMIRDACCEFLDKLDKINKR